MYVNLIDDNGKSKVFSLQKLIMDTFLEKGHVYYKIAPDESEILVIDEETKQKVPKQIFNNRIDQFVPKELYDRMTFKPTIYKTIRT